MKSWDLVGLKLPDISLTGEENPWKTSPKKTFPTGDRNRARCVIGAHATTCSTSVDLFQFTWFYFKTYEILISAQEETAIWEHLAQNLMDWNKKDRITQQFNIVLMYGGGLNN